MKHLLIGLTGQPSSGKSLIAKRLKDEHGFTVLSLSSILKEIAKAQSRKPTRKYLQDLGDDARQLFGPGILVEWLVHQAKALDNVHLGIDGLRTIGEVNTLKKLGGILVSIEVSKENLLNWYLERQKEGDQVSPQDFEALYDRENSGIEDGQINISKCMELADYHLANEGDIDQLFLSVDETLKEIRRQKPGPERK